jgi:3-hydroxyacyl-CoA dehydrogenase
MNYPERLENVAVLGAAGKMGSGIVLLTALEMADLSLDPANRDKEFTLHAVDVSPTALKGLVSYLREQVLKAAEKKAVALRKAYAHREDLVLNSDIIRQYVQDVMDIVHPTTHLSDTFGSTIVFEAASENPDLKVKLFSEIRAHGHPDVWIFTNTSSIPISELDRKAELSGRIIGFHFYNPPAVQKLVELASGGTTRQELKDFSAAFAKRIRKVVVPSSDTAGFIGNGHFMRDLLHAIAEAGRLTAEGHSFVEAVYMINKVSQEYLVRPMGIFQLIDYVGLDVCQCILKVMDDRIPGELLHSALIDELLAKGVRGGQFPDGSQRDGFLQYVKGRPSGVLDPESLAYTPVESLAATCDVKLGATPASMISWKAALASANSDQSIAAFYADVRKTGTLAADIATRYGKRSCEIGRKLVADGVAANDEDVNRLLLTGFFHAYGPINSYF